MRSAGDAPESLGEQTLNFRAIRDDDGPERAAEDEERVRQANGASPPPHASPPDAHTASMADDHESGAEDTFFAFARPAAHDLPRPDDHSTLDPEPAFDHVMPASDALVGPASGAFDAFTPATPATFDAFRAVTPARETPPTVQAPAPKADRAAPPASSDLAASARPDSAAPSENSDVAASASPDFAAPSANLDVAASAHPDPGALPVNLDVGASASLDSGALPANPEVAVSPERAGISPERTGTVSDEHEGASPEELEPSVAEGLAEDPQTDDLPDAQDSGGAASEGEPAVASDELSEGRQAGVAEDDVSATGDAEIAEDLSVGHPGEDLSVGHPADGRFDDVQHSGAELEPVENEDTAAASESDEDTAAGSETGEAAEGVGEATEGESQEPQDEAGSADDTAEPQIGAKAAAVHTGDIETDDEAASADVAKPGDIASDVPISDVPISDVAVSDVPVFDVPVSDGPVSDVPVSDGPVSDGSVSDVAVSGVSERDADEADDADALKADDADVLEAGDVESDASESEHIDWGEIEWGVEAVFDADADADADADTDADADAGADDGHVDDDDRAGSGGEVAGARSAVPNRAERVLEEDLPDAAAQALAAALDALKEAVADLRFGLELPGAEEARKAQAEILTQLQDYVLPRVRMSAAPALIVVAGSTGAGKSTLVNTLAEKNVSRTGVRRPTTGTPVLACHPDDEAWFADGELLAGLERIDRQSREAAPDSLVLVTTERLPQGVALLDTPDIDSVVEEHHEIARRMLDAADLWVFVTTAARYADAPAWNLLRLAKERAARIAIVLSRVQPKAKDVVLKHFVRMLTEYGLGEVERFVIEESAVADGKLPHGDMTELRMWLAELSVDEERRAQAVQDTLDGVLNSFRTRVPALARHLEGQVAFRAELRTDVDVAYSGALTNIETAIREGNLLHGEVRARWQDFAGSGDLTRSFRRKGKPVPPERITAFRASLRTAIESLITSAAHHASDEVGARWRRRSELGAGLDRPSDELVRRTGRAVAAWQEHVTELLRTDGVTKRSAKVVALDAESLSLIFMVGLFSADELPQKLLKGLLGAEALRSISAKALSDLRARIVILFDEEAMRYVRALDAAGIPDEAAATRLYQATYNLEVAR
ncbi:dynamin family protein [Nonomuraea sp. bgisy101]|uniref:dynamin family protein n=1 Tax=Nonomuraea sp. bgisy101 TaxID=3413784 RepID=UPI003D707467